MSNHEWMKAALARQMPGIRQALDAQVIKVRAQAMTGSNTPSITCPVCGRTSYNPNDVVHRYCGNCHQFHDNMTPALLSASGVTYGERQPDPPPELQSVPVILDFLWGLGMVLAFIGGKFGSSWLWLLVYVPAGAALIWYRIKLSQANKQIHQLALKRYQQ